MRQYFKVCTIIIIVWLQKNARFRCKASNIHLYFSEIGLEELVPFQDQQECIHALHASRKRL